MSAQIDGTYSDNISPTGTSYTRAWVLYRCFDRDGTLLYVGATSNWPRRFITHGYVSRWVTEIAELRLEAFGSREELIEAEARVIREEHPRNNSLHVRRIVGQQWSTSEIAELRRLAPMGARAAAEFLERSVGSVKLQAYRQGISLRRAGERRGTILGQPKGAGISSAPDPAHAKALERLRADVLAGRADAQRVTRRAEQLLRGDALCPACGLRPIEVRRTGTCQDCHLKALASAHAMEADHAEARRALDRERQRKHRALAGEEA